MIKSLFKWRKAKKTSAEDGNGDYTIFQNEPRRGSQITSTAAYHTVTRPRAHRGPRSCPGDLRDSQRDVYCGGILDRSFDSDTHIPRETIHRRRRQHQLQRFRRTNATTSEYGSGDPSPTTLYSTYNHNLDDSDSDSWTEEYERTQRLRELEAKLREQKKKVKNYKERLRAERDLRIVNERNMMEEVEKYKHELKKEQRERKATEQRYIDVISYMKIRLSLLEQNQSMAQRCAPPPPPLPILSDSTINLQNGMSRPPGGTGDLLYPLNMNASSSLVPRTAFEHEIDETKNFRAQEVFGDIETARSDEHTTTTTGGTDPTDHIGLSTTLLKDHDSDNDDNGYVTTCEYPVRATHKIDDTCKTNGPLRTSL